MSEQDNFDFGFDQQFGPDLTTIWEEFFNTPPEDNEGYEFMMDVDVQNHNNTLPAVPVQAGPTLDGITLNGAGSVDGDVDLSQSLDLPMSNSPLVNADQAGDQLFHTTPPAQDVDAQPMFNTLLAQPNAGGVSPIDFELDSNDDSNPGLVNNTTWTPAEADHYMPKPYPLNDKLQYGFTSTPMPTITAPQGHYPVPVQKTEWPNLERTLFQRGDQTMAGAADPSSPADLPQLAAPPALRKLAPKPALDVGATASMAQDSTDKAKPVPPPVVAVQKETKTQQPAPKTKPKKPTTSKAKQTAVKKPIDGSQLLVPTLDEAKQIAIKRIQLEVVDDDRDDVAAHPEIWVPKIAKALDADFREHAEDHERLTEAGQAEFTRWQVEHEDWVILSDKKENMSKFAQSCAMIFYKKVLEAHELGLEDVGKTIANGGAETTIKCSERINAAITAIEEYSIVKYDFLRLDRLEGLLASPSGFVKRKAENMLVNYKKKKDSKMVKKEINEKVSRAAPKAGSQGKRKRKEPLTSDDESEEEDEVEGESDEEFVQPTERTKRR